MGLMAADRRRTQTGPVTERRPGAPSMTGSYSTLAKAFARLRAPQQQPARVPTVTPQEIDQAAEMRRRRLQQMSLGMTSLSDTVATGPLGVVGEPNTGRKTLLGS